MDEKLLEEMLERSAKQMEARIEQSAVKLRKEFGISRDDTT